MGTVSKLLGVDIASVTGLNGKAIADVATIMGQTVETFANPYCLELDGVSSQYVNIRNYTTYDYAAAQVAPVERNFSFWYKATGGGLTETNVPFFGGNANVVGNRARNACGFGVASGALQWGFESFPLTGSNCFAISEAVDGSAAHPDIQDGNWHHIFLYNKVSGLSDHANIVNTQFWVDGANVPVDSSNIGTSTLRGFYDCIGVGVGNLGGYSSQIYMEGFIDEFAYWDGAYITDAAVIEIAGGPNDLDNLTNASDPDCWYRMGDNAPAYATTDPQWLIMNNKNVV